MTSRIATILLVATSIFMAPTTSLGQQMDGNPQNPSNWTKETVLEGTTTADRKEYVWVNFQQVAVPVHYSYVWGETFWKKNGVYEFTSFVFPFGKLIEEPDNIEYHAEGDYKLKLTWKNPAVPPPSSVRIWISTHASYSHSSFSGSGSCSDGIGSTTLVTQGNPETIGTAMGFVYRDVNTSSGVAEYIVSQDAIANEAGSQGQYPWVHASTGCSWDIDARFVKILSNGGEVYMASYAQATQETFERAYTHNVDWWNHTDHIWSIPYTLPVKKVIPTTFGSTSNSATWVLGVPAKQQLKVVENQNTTYTPASVPPHIFSFTGHPTSQGLFGEKHKWNGGPWIDGSTIAPQTVSKNSPYLLLSEVISGLFGENHTFETFQISQPYGEATELQLKYVWADGIEHTANRSISYVDPKIDVDSSIVKYDDNATGLEFGLTGWTQAPSVIVEVQQAWFNAKDVASILSFGADGAATALLFAEPPAAFVTAAAWASVLGLAAAFTPDGSVESEVYRVEHVDHWAEITPEGHTGPPLHQHPPTGTINDYFWKTLCRPKTKMQVVFAEVYGPNGYERLSIRFEDKSQYLHQSPRLYQFIHETIFSGGGGSGGGSGGNGGPGGGF